jgi:hypothetical protein
LLTSIIDAALGCDIASVDIPGAFIQVKMDKTVYMRIQGTMVELLVKLYPSKCKEFVHESLGKKTLYVKLQKAMYGTLRLAFLFWKKLSSKLQEWFFTIQVKNKSPEYLTLEKANLILTMVAKLLFLAKRARPDILTAVSFLCTRVKKPDVDDYKN